MSRFKNVHPLMIYMPIKQRANLKVFARKNRMPVSQAVREGILMRMAGGNDYTSGWNDALEAAMEITKNSTAGKMMFPSGRSFSQMLCEEISGLTRENQKSVAAEVVVQAVESSAQIVDQYEGEDK